MYNMPKNQNRDVPRISRRHSCRRIMSNVVWFKTETPSSFGGVHASRQRNQIENFFAFGIHTFSLVKVTVMVVMRVSYTAAKRLSADMTKLNSYP
jgi:hypothetical protein